MSFSQTLLPEFDEEMKNTRKILECVPDGKFDFQPHSKSMTLARLASHVAEMPGWGNTTLDTELLEFGPEQKPRIAQTRAELLEMFDRDAAKLRGKIEAATDEDWKVNWTCKYMGQVVISAPRSSVMRGPVMNHMIHHRAQLGVYLRLLEVAIPGVYGPSADEMAAWQPAKASA